jgi:hypothetical protein
MREYPVKKGFKTSKEEILEKAIKFSSAAKVEGEDIVLALPGLKEVRIQCGKKTLFIGTITDENYSDPMKSIKIFNNLLTEVTGYDSKERKKRFSKL